MDYLNLNDEDERKLVESGDEPSAEIASASTPELDERQKFLKGLQERLLNQSARASDMSAERGYGNALMQSANQIGSYNGKYAENDTLANFKKDLDAANENRLKSQYGLYEAQQKNLGDDMKRVADAERFKQSEANKKERAQILAGEKIAAADKKYAEDHPTDFKGKLNKLSSSDKARFDYVKMYGEAIEQMYAALANKDSRYSPFGDNDFTAALDRAAEAYGRMQSGGAISKDEENRFKNSIRAAGDDLEMTKKKLGWARGEADSRFKTLGFDVNEIESIKRLRDSSGNQKKKYEVGQVVTTDKGSFKVTRIDENGNPKFAPVK